MPAPDNLREAMLAAVLVNDTNAQLTLLGAVAAPKSPAVTTDPTIDAKIAASEARTDTKFAKLEGKLDLIVASLETVKSQAVDAKAEARTTRRYVVGTGFSLAALLLGIFALYANAFNIGTRVDDIARTRSQQTFNEMAERSANELPNASSVGNASSKR